MTGTKSSGPNTVGSPSSPNTSQLQRSESIVSLASKDINYYNTEELHARGLNIAERIATAATGKKVTNSKWAKELKIIFKFLASHKK